MVIHILQNLLIGNGLTVTCIALTDLYILNLNNQT